MTLNCVWYKPPLKARVPDLSCHVVNSFTDALRIFRKANDKINVLRVYNACCSVWIGLDLNESLILANSKSEFMRCRAVNGGVLM